MWPKIKVLLWKSLQLRKRHWCITIMEIIIPCLLFYFMNYLKSNLSPNGMSPKVVNETIPEPISELALYETFRLTHSSNYFIYSPKTKESEQIMKIVSNQLDIPFENIDTSFNEYDMIQKMKKKFNSSSSRYSNEGFGIFFEEIKKSQVFKYKIRSTQDLWLTDYLFPVLEVPGPMDSGSIYFHQGFLSLQLVLDKAFITLDISTNKKSELDNYNLNIQSYPYAKFVMDSQFEQLFQIFFPFFTVSSFLLMCSYTIKRIVEEKDSGVKELMKMMGLKSWMIWTGWILHNFFVYAISITIITYICCFEIYGGKGLLLLNYTNPLLLWIFLVMYMVTGIFFCFAISSFFNRPLIALITGSIVWSLSYSISTNFLKPTTNIYVKTLFMLLPNVAVSNGFTAISSLESQGRGLQFSTLFIAGNFNNSFSMGFVLFMFIIDCFLYGFIAWYLDSVMPGKYGIAKPFYFLCNWSQNKTEDNPIVPVSKSNSKLFEKPPDDYEVGISVQNLHKRFGQFHAVNGVNLDLYKGQITALLGHNGAGKTTTMSIITGICILINIFDNY